jgi:excisionase family DNA binding protein
MSRGNAVLVMPITAELTTQEAADLLNVSRPYLIRLLDNQKIPHHMVGRHRRILFKDLMDYRQKAKRRQFKAMQELTADDDELGIALAE